MAKIVNEQKEEGKRKSRSIWKGHGKYALKQLSGA
jgi:hypothetical protein